MREELQRMYSSLGASKKKDLALQKRIATNSKNFTQTQIVAIYSLIGKSFLDTFLSCLLLKNEES